MEKIWLKSYKPEVPETIDPDSFANLNDFFVKHAKQYAAHRAFTNLGVNITYQQLDDLSRDFAAYLQQELKLKKSDRVAIMLPNLLQYPVAIFGILRAGLIVVNVNPLYTARELKHQLSDAGVTTVIALANFAHVLAEILPEITTIKHVIIAKIGDLLGDFKGFLVNWVVKYIKHGVRQWNITNSVTFKHVMSVGKKLSLDPVVIEGGDIAFLQYTGGTTGIAKGAMLTHRNMVANILQCLAGVRSVVKPGEEVVIGALPFYHIFALTVCCFCFMALGSECVLVTNPRDLKTFIKLLAKTKLTIFIGLNTLFNGLLHQADFAKIDFSSLKLTIGGGMATQEAIAEKWKKITGVPVIDGYGLTEASPVVSLNPIDLHDFNGSVGLPLPSTDITVRDEEGHDVPLGQDGELWVRGPQVMKGYWNQPAETRYTIDEEGWLRTGDIVRIDEHGFIYIVDRKKDMILVSGFNVYPHEVEEVIMSYQGVKEVAAIGIPNTQSGEAIKAFIVKKDLGIKAEDIIAYCHKNLTGYKIPKQIEFRDELPKSNVGKVLRRYLRDEELKK